MAVCWASTPDWIPIQLREFDSRRSLQFLIKEIYMPKHIYHLPLLKIQILIENNTSLINEVFRNNNIFEYKKIFGKIYFTVQIKKFIEFFKINKDISYALQTINYFQSEIFLEYIYRLLNFENLMLHNKITKRDFFYTLLVSLEKQNQALMNQFLHQVFLHYFATLNKDNSYNIDFIDLSQSIAKNKKIPIKESFGKVESFSFFKLYLNGVLQIELKGKSIRILRKKAYKSLLFVLLSIKEADTNVIKQSKARSSLSKYKEL